MIIRKFDEQMIDKVDKTAVNKLYKYIDDTFQVK